VLFDALAVVTEQITALWDVRPCILVDKYQRFGENLVPSSTG